CARWPIYDGRGFDYW
nr:immunoglobulin heavy chain junction region [Mus musculus]